MAKPRSRTLDYCVYLAIRVMVCILQALSYETVTRLARLVAFWGYRLDRRHREIARENVRLAYPYYTALERDQLVRGVYGHFAHILMEIIHLPRRLHVHNWKRHVEVGGDQQIVQTLLTRRPLLIVTAHFGNWEMAGYALAMLGFRSYAVARPLDNPYLDAFLRRFREHTGQQLLAKKGELERMEGILCGGDIVCTLADQDAGPRGLFVDFFGRPASTHKAIALLALRHQVTLLVAGARKIGEPIRYRIEVADIIDPRAFSHETDAVRALTQRITKAIERLARLDPSQYFWLHRRWKNQPTRRLNAA